MLGITSIGMLHTAIALVAVAAGYTLLVTRGAIPPDTRLGRLYVATTVLTCLTGFFIFNRGGFNQAHVLGILTLLVLGAAMVIHRRPLFGRRTRSVETLAYTATLFFHMIPATVETLIRVPVGQPWASSPEDPLIQAVLGGWLLLFVGIGMWQWLRRQPASPLPGATLSDA